MGRPFASTSRAISSIVSSPSERTPAANSSGRLEGSPVMCGPPRTTGTSRSARTAAAIRRAKGKAGVTDEIPTRSGSKARACSTVSAIRVSHPGPYFSRYAPT